MAGFIRNKSFLVHFTLNACRESVLFVNFMVACISPVTSPVNVS